MPRYFFHMEDGSAFQDKEGTQLPDAHAARIEAARMLGQLLNEYSAEVWQDDRFRVTVTDAAGLILFTIDVDTLTGPATAPVAPRRARDRS